MIHSTLAPTAAHLVIAIRRWANGEMRGNFGMDSDTLVWMGAVMATTIAALRTWLAENRRSQESPTRGWD